MVINKAEILVKLPMNERRSTYIELQINPTWLETVRTRVSQMPDFMDRVLILGRVVDDGLIFQKVGGEYLPLSMRDITPLPGPQKNKIAEPVKIAISSEWETEIKHITGTFSEWFSRAVNLRLKAPNLALYRQKEAGVFEELHFEG